ncbi:hypothetical protein A2U01_0109896, partial [Trifolium medium]|nr:hypothetical protein [Trifolium medium]
ARLGASWVQHDLDGQAEVDMFHVEEELMVKLS